MMRIALFAAVLMAATPAVAWTPPPQTAATAGATAERPAPRETVRAVAAAIRERYFDPAAGERIAAALEAEAEAGAFDALTDPRDLAATLGARLRPSDAHFNVVYRPGEAPPRAGPRREPEVGGGWDPERHGNYGFRRVEVLPGNVGYIEMTGFANIDFDDPADPARRAADAALSFVGGTDAVIFDLRDNGGGAPSMVGYLVSAFTPADADIYNVFHSREGTESEAPAVFHPSPRLDVPVYVLISARTGSAGEAFPYTLQAAGRATIVGDASGGAANPGGMVPVGGGFAVFVSDGSPRNPITGGNWEGTGVRPDVAAPWDQALDRAHGLALQRIATTGDRPDAAWALEALQASPGPADLSAYAGAYGATTVRVEGDRLAVQRGRRPPVMLRALGEDLFTVAGDPTRRYRFERGPDGAVVAYEALSPAGPGPRARRTD